MLRRDGSIQSANLPAYKSLRANKIDVDYRIYRCMIIAVYFTDDEKNVTFDNKQVTYDAIVLGGRKDGQIITNCRLSNFLGGQYNYHERILRAAKYPFSKDQKRNIGEQTGDIVYISFVGKTTNPLIIGLGTHFLDRDTTGSTKADGARMVQEYNGVFTKIDKDGNYEFIRKGGTYNAESHYFVPADRATEEEGGSAPEELFQFKWIMNKESGVVWEDPKSKITLSKTNESYKMEIGEKKTTLEINGKADKISATTEGGVKLELDGAGDKATVETSSGAKIDVDGAGGVVVVDADGTTKITIDKAGTITLEAPSKVSIKAPFVEVGDGAAFSSTMFEYLMTAFSTHFHMAPQAPVGTLPTSPPTAPMPSLVGSKSVKVKE